jgi:hypothetical protein
MMAMQMKMQRLIWLLGFMVSAVLALLQGCGPPSEQGVGDPLGVETAAATVGSGPVIFEDTFSPQQEARWSLPSPSADFFGELNGDTNASAVTLTLPSMSAGSATVEFDLLGFRTLDDTTTCCTDIFTLEVNGHVALTGGFGDRGTDLLTSNPSGATLGPATSISGGTSRRISVPVSLIGGTNTFTFSYSPLQPLLDEAWGLDNVKVTGGACQIQGVPQLKQSGSTAPWRADHYDNRCTDDAICTGGSQKYDCGLNPAGTHCRVGYLGCHLTSAAMLLNYHGVAVSPGELNAWLSQRTPGPTGCASCYIGYTHGDVKPGAIEAYAASQGISLSYRGEIGVSELAAAICEHGPQIVGINGRHHWLVATGAVDAQATSFLVNDPASNGNRTQIDTTQINAVKVYSGPNSPSVNPAALVVRVYSPAELLVKDSLGRRVGTDPRTGESFDEIPNGSYRLFGLGDDNGQLDADPRKEVELLEPSEGEYKISVTGTGAGTYDLDVYAIDASGKRSELALEGRPVSRGSVDEYALTYGQDRGTGSLLRVVPDMLAPGDNRLVAVRADLVLPREAGHHVDVKLRSITCSPECDLRRDVVGADIGADDRRFLLRAARRGGTNRTYEITYGLVDSEGQASTVTAVVVAPAGAGKPGRYCDHGTDAPGRH